MINYRDDSLEFSNVYSYLATSNINQWYGKKIGLIGTSVAHGSNADTAYTYIAQRKLGFQTIPTATPGLAITCKKVEYIENGIHKSILSPLQNGSSCLTKAEYDAAKDVHDKGLSDEVYAYNIHEPKIIYPNNNWAGEDKPYNNYWRTWENIFAEENKDVSLWIYATIPNNTNFELTDWDNFDKDHWVYKDGTSLEDHRTTFLGAMVYLMDKMYKLNPKARMVLVIDSLYDNPKGWNCMQILSDAYNIPLINLWSNIITTPQSLAQVKSKNGTDPHPSTYGHECMGNRFANELLLIS